METKTTKTIIMKIITRISASGFIELKVDEIETTIFKTDENELENTIFNLLQVVEDLASISGKNFYFELKK